MFNEWYHHHLTIQTSESDWFLWKHPGAIGDRSRRHGPLLGVIFSWNCHKILALSVDDRPGLIGDPRLPRGRRRLSPFAPGPWFRWRRWFSWQLETSKPHCRPPRPPPAPFLAVHTMAMTLSKKNILLLSFRIWEKIILDLEGVGVSRTIGRIRDPIWHQPCAPTAAPTVFLRIFLTIFLSVFLQIFFTTLFSMFPNPFLFHVLSDFGWWCYCFCYWIRVWVVVLLFLLLN